MLKELFIVLNYNQHNGTTNTSNNSLSLEGRGILNITLTFSVVMPIKDEEGALTMSHSTLGLFYCVYARRKQNNTTLW
jgi:hypothetical protein